MSRGQGRVFRPRTLKHRAGCTVRKPQRCDCPRTTSQKWWLDYCIAGKRHREPTDTASKRDAFELLRQRIGNRRSGKLTGQPDKVTLAQLYELVKRQYAIDGRKSVARVHEAFKHLTAFFGAEARVARWGASDINRYIEHRLAAGRAPATARNELAQLRRGFNLAVEAGLLALAPRFKLPRVHNARSGFFDDGAFAAVLLELPADVRDLIEFLRSTGWRRDEGRLLAWASVDMASQTIRLEAARSKSGEPRTFPFGAAPPLIALLDRRWQERDGLFVFHRDGQPLSIGAVRSAWKRATKRAGASGRLVHDLRRTAARDFRRAGVSEGEIMRLAGWQTRSMFDRYNIIDEQDLARAVGLRYGQTQAKPEPAAQPADTVSSSAATPRP